MITRSYPDTTGQQVQRAWRFTWVDVFVVIGVLALIKVLVALGGDMRVQFDELHPPALDLDPLLIPYYTARTVLRMFIAFGFSLLFAIAFAYTAARHVAARKVMLPMLDILQSVPVLGFLSITVTGFIALFPGSLLGVECASIFAIFTSQAWNMAFGLYHSLITIPSDLTEAARVYRLNHWQRLTKVELPSSAIGLIWNSMMSFGGGWFFVAQSEAITVLNKNIKLPGLGSYMATAVEQGDMRYAVYAIVAMIVTIVAIDQFFWRPLVAWGEKFKFEQTAGEAPTSWFLELLRRSFLVEAASERIHAWLARGTTAASDVASDTMRRLRRSAPARVVPSFRLGLWVVLVAGAALLAYDMVGVSREIRTRLDTGQILHVVWLGVLTLLRVAVMTLVASAIWTPIGVWIGLRPRWARVAQPLAQIAASFPVNMTFPFVVAFFIASGISIDYGSILLIALGTQWYILFNVIAGAMAMPSDLREAASIFGLARWPLWKTLILPAIFPFWVTGAVTAAGGAWNASIVAEVASWGQHKLVAHGLGAYIAQVTEQGDQPGIYVSITVMALFVVIINRTFWRRLYALAERKYRLD
jgi:NitT/TauT family transport system permease protein